MASHESLRKERRAKGIAILAPLVYRDEEKQEAPTVRGFKIVHVFDIADTDGEPLPELATIHGDPGSHTERLEGLIAARGIELREVESLGRSLGRSRGGLIEIVLGLSAAKRFEVLAHELAHELLHHRPGEALPPKEVRELEAEAVALAVASGIGLDAGASTADYIGMYQGSPELLAASLTRIRDTACEILTAISVEPTRALQPAAA